MTGRLYIDNIDVYAEYGIYVTEGSWNELVAFPPLKAVVSEDWPEYDGVEADLTAPVLDSRTINLAIAIAGDKNYYLSLIELLSDGAYHIFNCAYIQRSFKLRLISCTGVDLATTLSTATLKLADDFPPELGGAFTPTSSLPTDETYTIDGIPLTAYGLRLLKGTLGEIVRAGDMKQGLTIESKSLPGVTYDGGYVQFKSKDAKLYCLMTAESLPALWNNCNALLQHLTQPGERVLSLRTLAETPKFHYKSCRVTDFFPEGTIWLQFELTITMTDNLRISSDALLITEDDIIVITESGLAVNMQRNLNNNG